MANMTTDHETLRAWIEQHGGQPALVRRADEQAGASEGALSFEFLADGQEPELVPISWADFFQRFDHQGLTLSFEDSAGAPQWQLTAGTGGQG